VSTVQTLLAYHVVFTLKEENRHTAIDGFVFALGCSLMLDTDGTAYLRWVRCHVE